MGVNKVEFDGKKLIDLTGDTVTPEVLRKGYTAHNSAGELVDGNFEINNQAKSVTLSTSSQTIKPDNGYDGLSQVTVPAIVNQEKTVNPSTSAQTVTPDTGKNGLSKVTVNAAPLQAKTVSPSASAQTVKPDSGQYGLSQVTVNAIALQEKTVYPSTAKQTVTPDTGKNGLSKVTVQSMTLQEKTVTPSELTQVIYPNTGCNGFSMITVNAAKLQNKSITPTSSIQTVYPDSGFYGLGAVSVAAQSSVQAKKGAFTLGATNTELTLDLGFIPSFLYCIYEGAKYGSDNGRVIIYDKNQGEIQIWIRTSSDYKSNVINKYTIGQTTIASIIKSIGTTVVFENRNSQFANKTYQYYAFA